MLAKIQDVVRGNSFFSNSLSRIMQLFKIDPIAQSESDLLKHDQDQDE